jgi:hypothetical protein
VVWKSPSDRLHLGTDARRSRARECRRLVNGDLMREADRVKRIGELFD